MSNLIRWYKTEVLSRSVLWKWIKFKIAVKAGRWYLSSYNNYERPEFKDWLKRHL